MNDPKRKIRFKVESLPASYDFKLDGEFEAKFHAVVINESYDGACLAARNDSELSKDQSIRVSVGLLAPSLAKVIWVEEVDSDIVKFGIKYQK